MSEQPGPLDHSQLRASDADRERVALILHSALAEGLITMGELEERLSIVYAAKTRTELVPVTADLPTSTGPATSANLERATTRMPGFPDTRLGGHPGSTTSIAIMSAVDRKGSWVLPPRHNAIAFWGGCDIDLRGARFAEKHSTITAIAIMGGIDITVPDDIHVDVTGIGFMGGFMLDDKAGTSPAPASAPTVKVTGLAFWGAVTITRKPTKPDPRQLEG